MSANHLLTFRLGILFETIECCQFYFIAIPTKKHNMYYYQLGLFFLLVRRCNKVFELAAYGV